MVFGHRLLGSKASQAFGFAEFTQALIILCVCVSLMDHLGIHVSKYFALGQPKEVPRKKYQEEFIDQKTLINRKGMNEF